MTIKNRIIIGLLLIMSFSYYYLIRDIIQNMRPHYLKSMEESLVDTATLLSSLISVKMKNSSIAIEDLRAGFNDMNTRRFSANIYDLIKEEANIRIYVTDKKGIVIFDSDKGKAEGEDYSKWNDVHLTLQGRYGARSTRIDEDDPTTSVLYIASPIVVNKKIIGSLTVCKPANSVSFFIKQAKNKVIIAGILSCIIVILLGTLLSVWVTMPINKLTAYARAVRDGKCASFPKLGHNEIGIMGEAFQQMEEALEGKKYVENYVQTFTHEIKGPLSAIRGAAELLNEEMPVEERMKFITNIINESDRIKKIINRLLELSILETRKSLKEMKEFDICLLIDKIIESINPLLRPKDITIKRFYKGAITIRAEQFFIQQAIVNLFQNAIDFSPKEGIISVSVERNEKDIIIIITDNGTGIPQYALSRVFDRFYSLSRPDTHHKSSGLGLTFVKEVASLHNGTITVENKEQGGLQARLQLSTCLPVAPHRCSLKHS
ncbi:MAG: two-component system sensor histidine kinase CreC [bacterium]